MSGFTRQDFPNQFAIRYWFGTNGDDTGINLGFDQINLGSQDIIYGYQGNDVISADLSPSVIAFGGQGNDSITGSKVFLSINILAGDVGNDTIVAQGGTITQAFGMQDNDTLFGSNANVVQAPESLFGGQGNDVVRGFGGADFLTGDRGADVIWGDEVDSAGSDTIFGGQDSDTMVGGAGDDTLYGGQGDDYIEVSPGLVNSSTETYIPTDLQDPTFNMVSGSDRVFGDAGNDTIGRLLPDNVSNVADWYDGGEGNDSIQGGNNGVAAIGDTLLGGNGNDTIRGGTTNSGRDSIQGGAGNDSIAGGEENGNNTNRFEDVTAAARGDTIEGGDGDDNIQGEGGHDSIEGGSGNDFIDGGRDSDVLKGGDQIDTIVGGAGRDSIFGGNDADILEGGADSDTLTGFDGTNNNDGTDRFVYNLASILTGNPAAVTIATPPAVAAAAGTYNNLPNAIAQAPDATGVGGGDYIVAFDTNQDVIQIGTLAGVTFLAKNAPAGTAPTSINFGGTPVNVGNTATQSAVVGSTNIQLSGTANSLIYIERDGIAGFNAATVTNGAGDIALVTVLGIQPTALQASNFA